MGHKIEIVVLAADAR